MKKPLKVISWGLGNMGKAMASLVLERPNLELVGGIIAPGEEEKDLGQILGLPNNLNITAGTDPEGVLAQVEADVVLLATSSFVKEVAPQIKKALQAGKNVITLAEEMAYPWVDSPAEARDLDRLARSQNLSVLGTGINPGFVLDTLILVLTGVCREVTAIRARRVNDLSPFGPTVMEAQGVGVHREEFFRGLEEGTIVGHIGFRQSIALLADALGWELDEIREEREPIIARVRRETDQICIEPGMVAGCRHSASGIMGGKPVIVLDHPQQVQPEREKVATGDYITLEGSPTINLEIRPEIPGGLGTASLAVNMIPRVVEGPSGIVTMKDLPLPGLGY